MRIAVIGAGAGGLMLGGLLSKARLDVTIFDGNEKCGKKIYITGKGRCNLTNDCTKEQFIASVVRGDKFMLSCISKFTPQDCMAYFEERGLKLKTERGNRVFPVSDKASDVTKILEKECKDCKLNLNEKVLAVTIKNEKFALKTAKGAYTFDKVIIATGGKSYSATGSEGDGYKFAKMLGHNIITPKPALVPIKLKDCVKSMQGLPLKNISLFVKADGKRYEQFGEMMFTDIGITGPIVLTMSSYINRAEKVEELFIDFKPALNEVQLEARLLREFEEDLNKNLFNLMRRLLPKNFVETFLARASLSGQRKVNAVTIKERERIIKLLKRFPLSYNGLYPIDAGIVTSGGVDLKEVNPSTMESKLIKNLYFIGEVLDVDCLTGGFNLQATFATANACAKAILKEVTNV